MPISDFGSALFVSREACPKVPNCVGLLVVFMLDVVIFPKENPPAGVPKLSVGAPVPDPKARVDELLVSWCLIASFSSGADSISFPKPFASIDFFMLPKPRKPFDVPEPNTAPLFEVDPITGAGEFFVS